MAGFGWFGRQRVNGIVHYVVQRKQDKIKLKLKLKIENKSQICDFSRYFSRKGKKFCHNVLVAILSPAHSATHY